MSITPAIELKLYDHTQGPRKIGPKDGKFVKLMSVGVRFMAWGEETGGGFSLVEHPIAPNTLAAPVHIHEREDEYRYVLEGRMGALLGDKVVYANEGDFVFKPRNQWHTFWNAGDMPCRILEIISPSGFEHFFDELADGSRTSPRRKSLPLGETLRALLRPRADGSRSRGARPPLPDAGVARRLSPRAYARQPNFPPLISSPAGQPRAGSSFQIDRLSGDRPDESLFPS